MRKIRKLWQKTRRSERQEVKARFSVFKKGLIEYFYRLKKVKGKHFVRACSNMDPWGVVYRMGSESKDREYLTSLNMKGVEYVTWKERASVMME